jgi:8-oxo-dGTP diphosphatase
MSAALSEASARSQAAWRVALDEPPVLSRIRKSVPHDPIIVNKRGDIFAAFHSCPEDAIPAELGPITHSLVVATHEGRHLLLLNSWKKRWEVPGGVREEGETPRQCALRELEEETNQIPREIKFRGIMEFVLQPDSRTEFGALYRTALAEVRPFLPNDEALEIVFWDGVSDIGEIDLIDRELLKY